MENEFERARHLSAMGEIDPSFVQLPDNRPNPKTVDPDAVAGEIPVIDLSVWNEELVQQVGSACQAWGFFQVINHGVPVELYKKVEICAKKFFEQSPEEKKKVKRDEMNPLGYYDGEHTKNVRDWKEIYDYLVKNSVQFPAFPDLQDQELRTISNRWPQYPAEFRETLEDYAGEVEKVAYRLLELVALSLGLPAQRLKGYFQDQQMSILRLNYYPPCPFPHLALGVGRHKDSGALTLLAQDDVVGLDVKRKSDGEWIPVKPLPNALVVNVADILQVWSNDKYESVEHRAVLNSEKGRISIPFFFFPDPHVVVKPLEELVNEQNPARYREYSYGKYYANRIYGDFKKREVDNLQIHHFKILD
ncbi:protein DMR6-LIKE OXYGENASE 2-like [Prosopis cineraria]|uniref:protein DMR6-LIKE OXYGENASE 2-like n=1 Tax=Prosopis cineraria TaxID=364024 RepID=UPI0024109332|nr:protein DMR6-LIKE OXYGENASE 2-like [Prosopis cineraria]